MRALARVEPRANGIDGREVEVVEQRALGEVEGAERIHRLAFGHVVQGLVVELQGRPAVEIVEDLAQVADGRCLTMTGRRHPPGRSFLDLADVGHQHRVVGGHRATGLGEDVRRSQPVLGAGLGQRGDDGRRVLVEAVVHRAFAARTRALVVHGQPAADVHVADPES